MAVVRTRDDIPSQAPNTPNGTFEDFFHRISNVNAYETFWISAAHPCGNCATSRLHKPAEGVTFPELGVPAMVEAHIRKLLEAGGFKRKLK